MHYLNDSIYLWNCCNEGQLLNKKVIMKCLAIKMFAWNFYNSQFKNIIATLRIVTIEKLALTFLLILYFHVHIPMHCKIKKIRDLVFESFIKMVLRSVLLGSSTSRTKGDHLIDLMWRLVIVFFARLSHTTSTVITQL